MSADLAVRGATIVSSQGRVRADLLVEKGRVAGIVAPGAGAAREQIEADGLFLLPGAVDPHVHLQDPGLTHQETFTTGTGAGVVGGVTCVVEHHRSIPFVMNADILRDKAAYLADKGLLDYALFGGIDPQNLDDIAPMWAAGAAAFKIFTCEVHHVEPVFPDVMLAAFRQTAALDAPVLVHCEDDGILKWQEKRLREAGRKDARAILEWRIPEAEQVAASTTATLSRLTGARVTVAHCSHPLVIDLIRQERARGAQVFVESCPQYFYLNEEIIAAQGPWTKFTPPARDALSAAAMWDYLDDGLIHMICADHAPSTREEKLRGQEDIFDAPFGVPGIETVYPLMLTGVNQGLTSLERLVWARSEMPARFYGLWPRKGHLGVGADADFILVNMAAEKRLSNETIVAKCGWTPYAGQVVRGLPVRTYVRGRLMAADGRPVGEPGWGQFIPGSGFKG